MAENDVNMPSSDDNTSSSDESNQAKEEEDIYIPLTREEEMIFDLQKTIKDLKQRELSCVKALNYNGSFPPSRKMVCCLKHQLHEIKKKITKRKKRFNQLQI
ncbi:hypothetical protein TVAG_413230 [Trichomonas vaginalis G3]|uniref:Uncharacterized protein n=1 Tax=Trichomonas vaginalis (strain ATCC PRA-98 / G3) TaxID=412133 RepID=A2G3W9_TRIV3|nr:hypothetical protein TVAGG3_0113530 [Trichomonas vaginalis G3]EAX88143.1 hypothetical protein TVAG_413230 [Trichomonas vaginalis G3]KAI5545069.1 hypothetical protein TVAGG3_0113530 [Trichomonas vaginalis G3]|eukprot:XP_001301073.1 hypothetical protein [Trichomonas vaginalis G3]